MEFPLYLLAFYLAFAFGVALHEAGHALAARAVGFRVAEIRLGRGPHVYTFAIRRTAVSIHAYPFSGWVLTFPVTPGRHRWREFVVSAAGPAASFALAGCALVSFLEHESVIRLAFVTAAAWHGVASLTPNETDVGAYRWANDGLQLFRILFQRNRENSYALALCSRAWQHYGKRRFGLAARLYLRAIGQPGFRPTAATQLFFGAVFSEARRVEAAWQALRSALAAKQPALLAAERQEALDRLASLAIYHQRPDLLPEARQTIEAAIAEFPEAITLRGTYAGILYEQGEIEAARRECEHVLAQSKTPIDIALGSGYLALIVAAEGDRERASSLAEAAHEAIPTYWPVQRLIERVEKACGSSPHARASIERRTLSLPWRQNPPPRLSLRAARLPCRRSSIHPSGRRCECRAGPGNRSQSGGRIRSADRR
jgi:tetratricopeptide (TPR) repeat protein